MTPVVSISSRTPLDFATYAIAPDGAGGVAVATLEAGGEVALFRFVPTAALGVFLALLTMLTGSIYPAMLWPALSNGLSILLHLRGVAVTQLDAPGYLAGAGLLAVAIYIAWRHQTPYPGLRPWRKQHFEAMI